MVEKSWGLVALENGTIQGGVISEHTLSGEKVLKVEPPVPGYGPAFEYHKLDNIKGIRFSTQEDVSRIYPELIELNRKLKS